MITLQARKLELLEAAGLEQLVVQPFDLSFARTPALQFEQLLFDGVVSPRKPRVSIVISQQQPDGSLTAVRTIRLKPNSDGSFTRTIGFPNAGQYQVIAHTAPDDANALGTSAPVAVTVG